MNVVMKRSISDPNMLKIMDANSQTTYFGCDQEWYATEWQRCAGCGPSVVSTMLLYLNRLACGAEQGPHKKEECVLLMEDVWRYVTPTEHGIPTTKMLYEDVLNYAQSKGLAVQYHVCDIPEDPADRPALITVLDFIDNALAHDLPVAFLNRCNGDEKNLDRWHWVTIIDLEYEETGETAWVTILDEGIMKRIDFALWYRTTTQGGGLVYFAIDQP